MKSSMIRYHKPSNTYITSKNSYFDKNISVPGNLIAGLGTCFWGDVSALGTVMFGKNSSVGGNVSAERVVLSSGVSVRGQISAAGDVSILTNARVGSVVCGGHLTIMDKSLVGFARSNELIEIIGSPKILEIDRVTKTIVRKDTALPFPEDPDENDSEDFSLNKEDDSDKKDSEKKTMTA